MYSSKRYCCWVPKLSALKKNTGNKFIGINNVLIFNFSTQPPHNKKTPDKHTNENIPRSSMLFFHFTHLQRHPAELVDFASPSPSPSAELLAELLPSGTERVATAPSPAAELNATAATEQVASVPSPAKLLAAAPTPAPAKIIRAGRLRHAISPRWWPR